MLDVVVDGFTRMHDTLCRREVLKTWMDNMMLRATYGNLLKVFVEAGHLDCVNMLFDVLEEKGEASILVYVFR